jgi:hypothetical protein
MRLSVGGPLFELLLIGHVPLFVGLDLGLKRLACLLCVARLAAGGSERLARTLGQTVLVARRGGRGGVRVRLGR